MAPVYSQDFSEIPDCELFEEEGPFVEVPADTAYHVFKIPGIILGVGLVLYASSQTGLIINSSMGSGCLVIGGLTGRVGYYFTGGVFFLTKNLFYDIPKKAIEKTREKVNKTSKGKSP